MPTLSIIIVAVFFSFFLSVSALIFLFFFHFFFVDDVKNNHLKKLEESSDRLKLFKADLLNYDSILMAVRGCNGVFHVASPVPSSSVPNPEVRLIANMLTTTLFVVPK